MTPKTAGFSSRRWRQGAIISGGIYTYINILLNIIESSYVMIAAGLVPRGLGCDGGFCLCSVFRCHRVLSAGDRLKGLPVVAFKPEWFAREISRMENLDLELTTLICGMVASGDTLQTIGLAVGMAPSSVFVHVCRSEEGRAMYAKARDSASDLLESEILEACRNVKGNTAQADRVKIDGLKWVAARRSPKKYGDRVVVDSTSSDGTMLPQVIQLVSPEAGKA